MKKRRQTYEERLRPLFEQRPLTYGTLADCARQVGCTRARASQVAKKMGLTVVRKENHEAPTRPE